MAKTLTQQRRGKAARTQSWWRVSRISGARTITVGEAEAADAEEAVAKAADKFDVPPAHRGRLIARARD
jgi:membrane-bound lytic murein transglycosylase B